MAADGELTDKRQRFVEEYFACGFNATRAARAAGYSEASIRSIASELLTFPDVRAAIDKRMKELAADANLMRDLLVRELVSILCSDLAGLVTWDDDGMTLVPSADLTAEQATSLKDVSMTIHRYEYEHNRVPQTHQVTRSKVGQHDKIRAAELLAKLHGLGKEKLELSGRVGLTLDRLHELAGSAEAGDGDAAD